MSDTLRDEISESAQWSGWHSASNTYDINYRTRKEDDLGNGNFAWRVQISHGEPGLLEFDYKIEGKKANGTDNIIEEHTTTGSGMPFDTRLSAERIVDVTTSNVIQV